jgi:hypothetical protein
VHFDGTALRVSGSCPNLSFLVDFRSVVTNESTDYKHGSCDDLSSGDEVTIDGTEQRLTVTATRIDMKRGHGHNN